MVLIERQYVEKNWVLLQKYVKRKVILGYHFINRRINPQEYEIDIINPVNENKNEEKSDKEEGDQEEDEAH